MNLNDEIKEKYFNLDEIGMLLIHYEADYKKIMLEKYDFSKVHEYEISNIIYPSSWDYVSDDAKIEALKEAIENKIALLETKTLNQYLKSL